MPRVTREQTEKNRSLIEDASARLFREQGLDAVSVANLMASVGLTHGGFYGHFASKDELAAVACAKAFEQSGERWAKRLASSDSNAAALDSFLTTYLSTRMRDDLGNSCCAPSLAVDVARQPADKPVRAAYLQGVRQMTEMIASIVDDEDAADRRRHALTMLSTIVGAQILARATKGDAISDDFLDAVKTSLIEANAGAHEATSAHESHESHAGARRPAATDGTSKPASPKTAI
ncbi:MAG: TetR family transcriptional regulator [Rhizobacter sp.]|nr:TetR family transcriptional regulator [Rhizobacter sp.]